MSNRRRMNLTISARLAKKIRARAAELGTTQSAVIADVLGRHLIFEQLDDIESRLARTQYEFDILLEAFAEVTEPRFFELMREAEKRLEEDVTRGPKPTN